MSRERPHLPPEDHQKKDDTGPQKKLWNPYEYTDEERGRILAAKRAELEEELREKRNREAAEITRRGLFKLGVRAVGTVVAGGIGGAVYEEVRESRYRMRQRREEEEMKEYLRKYEKWEAAQARVDEIKEERRRLRRLGPGGQSRRGVLRSVVPIPEVRSSTIASERTRLNVEKMMYGPGFTLSKEVQELSVRAADSRVARRLLNLPPEATPEQLSDQMTAFHQVFFENIAEGLYQKRFGGSRPGEKPKRGDISFEEKFQRDYAIVLNNRETVESAVLKYSKMYGVPARVIYGIIGSETPTSENSDRNKNWFEPNGENKAWGMTQVEQGAATEAQRYSQSQGLGLRLSSMRDLTDIDTSIHAGTAYIASLYYGNNIRQWGLTLSAYNGGAGLLRSKVGDLKVFFPEVADELQIGNSLQRLADLGVNATTLRAAGTMLMERSNLSAGDRKKADDLRPIYPYRAEFYGHYFAEILKMREE